MRQAFRTAALTALLATGVTAGCSGGTGPIRSPGEEITLKPGLHGRTFGDTMQPLSTSPTTDVTVESGTTPPSWGDLTRIPWTTRGAFTPSQKPVAVTKLSSDIPGTAQDSSAYPGTNGSLKNADVSFTITAQRFALVFPGNKEVDSMVWIDSRPVAAQPIVAQGQRRTATTNWLSITLPARKTVTVRFAGPLGFTGLDVPTEENADVKATKPAVTLGVLSDSFYDVCMQALCMSRTPAPELATLTGFRVWNLSEVGTGYLNPGRRAGFGLKPSPFGSPGRLKAVAKAPIDALLIGGSINDGLMPERRYRVTVDRLLTTVERTRPELPIVLLGVEPLSGEFEGAFWRKRGEKMTAVLRSMVTSHPNVVGFIDPFSTPWLTGTGSIAKPNGDGNADQFIGVDGIHLSIAGAHFYNQKVVAALRTVPFPPSMTPASTTQPSAAPAPGS